MYLEAHIKVTKMYRKGDMSRKKCKEREGGTGMTETQTVKEKEIATQWKKLLGQLHGTLPVCKSQLIKAALMTYNN